jgi:hypothetical protein
VSFNYDKVCGCVEPEERDPIAYNNTYLERFRRAAPWIKKHIDVEGVKQLLDASGAANSQMVYVIAGHYIGLTHSLACNWPALICPSSAACRVLWCDELSSPASAGGAEKAAVMSGHVLGDTPVFAAAVCWLNPLQTSLA